MNLFRKRREPVATSEVEFRCGYCTRLITSESMYLLHLHGADGHLMKTFCTPECSQAWIDNGKVGGVSVKIRVKRNDLPAIAAKLPVARRVILGKRGVEMMNIARRLSRIDTGDMIQGWEWRETHNGGTLANDVPHTVYNEYGTSRMSAQPMARPAAEQVFPLIREDFSNLERYL